MRPFFAPPPPAAAPPPVPVASGGLAALGGWQKLGLAALAVSGFALWAMWPSAPPPPAKPAEADHAAAPISDFQASVPLPVVQNVLDRTLGDGPPQGHPYTPPPPRRIIPVEMGSYSGPLAPPPSAAPTSAKIVDPDQDDEAAALRPTTAVAINRGTIVRHPDYVIRPGAVIPCLPVDAQNTTRPSFSTCRVPAWFRGDNLRRGLLPPGTLMFGSIRQGLAAGQERLGITYSLIETPWYDMPVQSPAGDLLGRGGVDAETETFFWDRAGAVALYALIDTTIGIGQNQASAALSRSQGGGQSFGNTNLNFQNSGQSLAGKEFDARINRPPVGTRDQALPVTVTVGQILDFYGVCRQAQRADPSACPLMTQ